MKKDGAGSVKQVINVERSLHQPVMVYEAGREDDIQAILQCEIMPVSILFTEEREDNERERSLML